MTTRTFGGWHVNIIGPRAVITGPSGTQLFAGAQMLRNMAGSSRIKPAQAEAYAWAIEQLEGAE